MPLLFLALFACKDSAPADDSAPLVDSADVNTDPSVVPSAEDYFAALEAASWASGVTLSVSGDTLTVSSDGVPDHEVLEAYALANGSTIGVSSYNMRAEVPLSLTYTGDESATGLGTIGPAISGAVFFNPYEGDGSSVALDNNFETDGVPFLDACSGHPMPSGETYHYHGIPYCITDVLDADGRHSVLIGLLGDGFPIYGPNGVGGAPPDDLDACSGHTGATPEFPEGIYHYHMTDSSPYSITCYNGEAPQRGGP